MQKDDLFIFLVYFWILLIIISNIFDVRLTDVTIEQINPETPKPHNFLSWETLEGIPIINWFVPIAKIMTFSYSDEIPKYISWLLISTSIFSAYVVFSLWRNG